MHILVSIICVVVMIFSAELLLAQNRESRRPIDTRVYDQKSNNAGVLRDHRDGSYTLYDKEWNVQGRGQATHDGRSIQLYDRESKRIGTITVPSELQKKR